MDNVVFIPYQDKGYPFVLEMAKAEKERVDAGGEKRFHFDFAFCFSFKLDWNNKVLINKFEKV